MKKLQIASEELLKHDFACKFRNQILMNFHCKVSATCKFSARYLLAMAKSGNKQEELEGGRNRFPKTKANSGKDSCRVDTFVSCYSAADLHMHA